MFSHTNLRIRFEPRALAKARFDSIGALPVCINKQADIQSACDWIIACYILHNIVNSCRRDADTIESCDDSDDAEMGRNKSDATRIRTIGLSVAAWRRETQKKCT